MRLLALPFLSPPSADDFFSLGLGHYFFFSHPLSLRLKTLTRSIPRSLLSRKSGAFAEKKM
jgi:hypothetical protein